MTKMLLTIVGVLLFTINSCFAFYMSYPEKIGEYGVDMKGGGVRFKNASNSGSKNAQYGNSKDALYIYAGGDYNQFYLGGKDKKNTVLVEGAWSSIYKIATDSDITFYVLRNEYGMGMDYTIIGRRKDGRFVKYIDTRDLSKKYYGINGFNPNNVIGYKEFEVLGKNDALRLDCYRMNGMNNDTWLCRFVFPWDENAQWFGIQQLKH